MRTTASNSTPVSVVTFTVRGVVPSFSSVTPETEKASSPVRPRESAVWPSGNWSGRTPMPMRFERWMRS